MSSSSSSEESTAAGGSASSSSGNERVQRVRINRKRKLEEMVDKRVATLKTAKAATIKCPSHRKRYNFNVNILQDLCAAKSKARGNAQKKVKKAMKKIWYRNKLIRITHKLKARWKTVEEIEGDLVAKDAKERRRSGKQRELL